MAIEVVWSSGTGNSRRAALWFAEAARVRGRAAMVRGLQDPPPSLVDGDLLVLAYPTHGFTAPWSMLRYVLRLPSGRGISVALLATRGGGWYLVAPLPGFAGSAAWAVAFLLWMKGYGIVGLTGLDLPANWTAIHPSMNSRHAHFFSRRARVKVRRFTARILGGRRWILTPCNLVELVLGLALLPISLGYLFIGRLFLSQLFFADSRCDGCNLCVQTCPEGAIRPGGRHPRWTLRCESCHRCMAVCPKQAVQAHHGLLVLGLVATSLGLAPLALRLPWLLHQTLEWASMVGFLLLLQHVVSRLRGLPLGILSFSTLTHWYRRYREADTRIRDLKAQDK